MEQLGKALTWEELADIYDQRTNGRKARTLPMEYIFEWAQNKVNEFKVTQDGALHKIFKTDRQQA